MRHRRRRHGLTETLWGLKLDRSVNALYQCAWSLSFGGDGRILNASLNYMAQKDIGDARLPQAFLRRLKEQIARAEIAESARRLSK